MICPRCTKSTPAFSTRCPQCTSEHSIVGLWVLNFLGWILAMIAIFVVVVLLTNV
jgi:hypothetical protein